MHDFGYGVAFQLTINMPAAPTIDRNVPIAEFASRLHSETANQVAAPGDDGPVEAKKAKTRKPECQF
jgi:hypothetical protein